MDTFRLVGVCERLIFSFLDLFRIYVNIILQVVIFSKGCDLYNKWNILFYFEIVQVNVKFSVTQCESYFEI